MVQKGAHDLSCPKQSELQFFSKLKARQYIAPGAVDSHVEAIKKKPTVGGSRQRNFK